MSRPIFLSQTICIENTFKMGCEGSKAQIDKTIDGCTYEVLYELQPFGKGACRLAFTGEYKGYGPLDGKPCVTKIFIDEARRAYSDFRPDIMASKKAIEFAEKFNQMFATSKPLRFVKPVIATVTSVPMRNEYAAPGDKISVEDFIKGKYEKFNSNSGWKSDDVASIPAFSHFTYHYSGGKLLVCDIQGVRSRNGYALTDPAVHSRTQGAYGPTDLGPTGMAMFFDTHKCTSLCSQFTSPVINYSKMINSGRRDRKPSSYTFMLNGQEKAANKFFQDRTDLPAICEEE